MRECCGVPAAPGALPVAELDFVPPVIPVEEDLVWVAPVATAVKERALEGRAYVNFPVNRTEIFPDYMNNPAELRKITASIDTVRGDADAHIESITLTGYASPEGPYLNNVRLAKGRTEAVRAYVGGLYDFPPSVYVTASVPEDWGGLREYIERSDMLLKGQMLDFIDSGWPVEGRNDRFRELFPAEYAVLLRDVYPWLRHTDYLIKYTLRHYTDVGEIRRVLAERPENLDLDEIYLLASECEEGSEEWCGIFETAARLFPHDPLALVNAANAAMRRGDTVLAESYLLRAGDSGEAEYARAMAAAQARDWDRALEHLARSSDPKAPDAISRIARLKAFMGSIKYMDGKYTGDTTPQEVAPAE